MALVKYQPNGQQIAKILRSKAMQRAVEDLAAAGAAWAQQAAPRVSGEYADSITAQNKPPGGAGFNPKGKRAAAYVVAAAPYSTLVEWAGDRPHLTMTKTAARMRRAAKQKG